MPKYRAVNAAQAKNDPNKVYEIDADSLSQAVDILIEKRHNAINREDTRHEVKPESPNIPLQNVYIYSEDGQLEHWAVQEIV